MYSSTTTPSNQSQHHTASSRSLISVDCRSRLPRSTIRPWILDYMRQGGSPSISTARSTSRDDRYGRPFDDDVAEVITTLQRLLVCSSQKRAFLATVSGDCPRCIAMLSFRVLVAAYSICFLSVVPWHWSTACFAVYE